jgi:hypothetical protein
MPLRGTYFVFKAQHAHSDPIKRKTCSIFEIRSETVTGYLNDSSSDQELAATIRPLPL